MPGMSQTLANALLDTLRGEPFAVTETWLQLHTGEPGPTGSLNVSEGSAERHQIDYSDPDGGVITAIGGPTWTNTSDATETVTHLSLFDGDGRFLLSAEINQARLWEPHDTLTFADWPVSIAPRAAA